MKTKYRGRFKILLVFGILFLLVSVLLTLIFLEGKKTYLMIMAMSHANEEQREVLRTTHLRSDLSDDEKIATIKALYESLNIRSLTEQQITLRINRALSILETVSVAPSRTEQMRRYVESLVGRNY